MRNMEFKDELFIECRYGNICRIDEIMTSDDFFDDQDYYPELNKIIRGLIERSIENGQFKVIEYLLNQSKYEAYIDLTDEEDKDYLYYQIISTSLAAKSKEDERKMLKMLNWFLNRFQADDYEVIFKMIKDIEYWVDFEPRCYSWYIIHSIECLHRLNQFLIEYYTMYSNHYSKIHINGFDRNDLIQQHGVIQKQIKEFQLKIMKEVELPFPNELVINISEYL